MRNPSGHQSQVRPRPHSMISARGDYANQCNMAYIKNPNNITRHQSQLFNDRFDFFLQNMN